MVLIIDYYSNDNNDNDDVKIIMKSIMLIIK